MTQFGIDKRKGLYDKYIGKWVIIYPTGINNSFSGKMVEINEGNAILNPFQFGEVKEGKLVRKLISNSIGSTIPLVGSVIEPVTEEYLVSYCELMNKKDNEETKKSDKINKSKIRQK